MTIENQDDITTAAQFIMIIYAISIIRGIIYHLPPKLHRLPDKGCFKYLLNGMELKYFKFGAVPKIKELLGKMDKLYRVYDKGWAIEKQ